MNKKDLVRHIGIAKSQADISKEKSVMHANDNKDFAALVYAIRHEALLLYAKHLKKQIKAKEGKAYKKANAE